MKYRLVLLVAFLTLLTSQTKASANVDVENVMRKAIVSAPLHLRGVERYEANIYIKGGVVFTKIPQIISANLGSKCPNVNYAYMLENFSFVEFNAPNVYKQTVLSERNTIPEELLGDDFTLKYFNFNLYNTTGDDLIISPLSKNAFAYYRFEFIDSLTTTGEVYGIKVTPRIKNKQLFYGVICIDDETWQLSYVNLKLNTAIGPLTLEQQFVDIGDGVKLPKLQSYNIDLSLLGVKGKADYIEQHTYNTVKHSHIETKTKQSSKWTNILSKELLTRRDMRKGVRYSRKIVEEFDSLNNDLEIVTRNMYYVVDTLKLDITSNDWDNLRPIGLTELETASINKAKKEQEKPKQYIVVEEPGLTSKILKPRWNIGKGCQLSLMGFSPSMISYHTVTGLSLSNALNIDYNKGVFKASAGIDAGYAFSAKRFYYKTYATLGIGKRLLTVEHGDKYVDWKGEKGELTFNNSFSSFINKRNHKILVNDKFWHFIYTSEPLWGMKLQTRLLIDQYTPVENSCNVSLFKQDRDFAPNIPINRYLSDNGVEAYEQATASVHISYTPRLKYSINKDGIRKPVGSAFPTIGVTLSQGISALRGNTDFFHLNCSLSRRKTFSMTDCFNWDIEWGKIFNGHKNGFATWQHFAGSDKVVGLARVSSGYNGFVMFRPYELSTNDWYLKVGAHYQTQSLLIKKIPLFRNWLYTEELHFKTAVISNDDIYTEFGYGLGQILLVLRTSAFVSFHNGDFQAVRFRMAFSLGDLLKATSINSPL